MSYSAGAHRASASSSSATGAFPTAEHRRREPRKHQHALRTGRDPKDYDLALRGALDSARRLTDLAEDLLQLARLEATSDDASTSVEDALADAIADVAPLGRTRDVLVIAEPLSATVHGDRRGLARLFRNVLENAVRFSPNAGRVRVEGVVREGGVRISVTDTGPGIVPGDEERIFDPFARGLRDDGAEGTGLGLTIARGLARAFGGDVTAEPGEGGRIFVELRASPAGRFSEGYPPRPST